MQEGEYIGTDGPNRLHLTYGDDEPLRGKAVYMIRASEKAMDQDKVSCGFAMAHARIYKG